MNIYNLKLSEVAVKITSIDELDTLQQLLDKYDQPIASDGSFSYSGHSSIGSTLNYAKFDEGEWWLGRIGMRSPVTLSQLETILLNNSQIITNE